MVTFAEIEAARTRVAPYVRHTPTITASQLLEPPAHPGKLSFKLESLQVTGSFKARGVVNKISTLPPEQLEHGLVAASGGNHGIAVAYGGWLSKHPATIYLPTATPDIKVQKAERWGAKVVKFGDVFDEANAEALAYAERVGAAYFHPFDDAAVIAGQGTVMLEWLEDQPDLDVLLIAVGGGGLISGMSVVAKTLRPSIHIIGVEPVGAAAMKRSLEANELVQLKEITTVAGTLAPRKTGQINFDHVRTYVDEMVLVTDDEMRMASRWLWREMNVAAEMSGAAAMAALLCQRANIDPAAHVGVLVCGAGSDGIDEG